MYKNNHLIIFCFISYHVFDVNIDVNTNLYLNITKALLSNCILTLYLFRFGLAR